MSGAFDIFDLFLGDEPKIPARRENGNGRPKGYADWRPQRKTRELLRQVEAVLEKYAEHLPLTVRQIFYSLVATTGYPKTENAYTRLCEHLVRARRARLIPFEAIRDDGATTCSGEWHAGVEDFWDDAGRRAERYRRDRQAGQPKRVELWCESAGMAPQLARVADEFSVKVYSAGGFVSLTAIRQIANRALAETRPTVLLHVGDFDPSGESIFESMAADAAAFVEADRTLLTERVEAHRVALTADQVAEYDLPTAPAKSTDSRSAKWKGGTCQLEALPPDALASIVSEAIIGPMRFDVLEEQVLQERLDREALLRALPSGRVDSSEADE